MLETAPRPPQPGVVGGYRLLDKIGEGGMGVVYRAEETATGQRVAVKMVSGLVPRLLGAMRSEIAALQMMRHPGVVRILDQGLEGGLPWYAMELLTGKTLADFNLGLWGGSDAVATRSRTADVSATGQLATGVIPAGLPPDRAPGDPPWFAGTQSGLPAAGGHLVEALSLYRGVCAPLAYLHTRGIVHRDLKPSNLFIRADGTPVLVDFGLTSFARGVIGRENLGGGERALGTVIYVAPEQIDGGLVDARADLYSLGCMMYQTITGKPPFHGGNVLRRHREEAPVPPSELVSGVPVELDDLVLGLLAKLPRDRLGYAADVATALSSIIGDHVIPRDGIDASAYLYRPQIVGRQDVLAMLTDHRERAVGGTGALVLLGGESGIGKTFLLSEFAQRSARRRLDVVTGECVPLSAAAAGNAEFTGGPLHALRRLFQSLADRCHAGGPLRAGRLLGKRAALLASYEPALLPFAGTADGLQTTALPPDAQRERLLQCLTELVAAAAAEGPLVLLVDDLQWADDLTLAFLARLTPEFLQSCALLVVAAYRKEEVGPELAAVLASAAHRIEVGRLDTRAVETIAQDMLAMPAPPPELLGFLSGQSEGNPFFIAEYLRLLVSEGLLQRSHGRWSLAEAPEALQAQADALPAPRSLVGIVARRLAALDALSREVIEAAAVVGREFSLALVAAVAGVPRERATSALHDAKGREVIDEVEQGRYRFVHDKLRESAYAGIDEARRRALHGRAAEAIERTQIDSDERARQYPDLAHHFTRAGNPGKALEYLEKAGDEALAKSANKDAISFLSDAVEMAQAHEIAVESLRLARWHRQIGDALQGLGDLERAAEHLRKAAGLLGYPAPTSRARLALSLFAGIGRQALHRIFPGRLLGSGRRRSEALREAARAHDRLQGVLYYWGDALAMFHSCVETLNLSEQAEVSAELTTAYVNAHVVTGVIPARALAEAYYRRACETNARVPDPNAESYLRLLAGLYRIGTAAWTEAQAELERGLTLAREVGFLRRWEELNSVNAVRQYLQGQFAGATASAEVVYQSALRGDYQTQCWGLVDRAQVLLVQGHAGEAVLALTKAERLVTEKRLGRMERLLVLGVLARATLHHGSPGNAASAARRALAEIEQGPPISFAWIDPYAAVAEVFTELASRADAGEARRLRAEARQACRALGPLARVFPAAAPRRWLWQGRLAWLAGHRKRAATFWKRSVAAAQRLSMPHDEGLALLALYDDPTADEATRQASFERGAGILKQLGVTAGPTWLLR